MVPMGQDSSRPGGAGLPPGTAGREEEKQQIFINICYYAISPHPTAMMPQHFPKERLPLQQLKLSHFFLLSPK